MSKDAQLPAGRVLIVGLGNPGSKYVDTRHNIGFRVAEELSARFGVRLNESKFRAALGTGLVAGRTASIVLPQTYMNLSGESVGAAAHFWRLGPESIVVAHDDIDLVPGKVKLKIGGGHGGHNGLRSLDRHLPTKEYFRIRLGVGRPEYGDASAWVLGRFGKIDTDIVRHLIDVGADAIEELVRGGLLAAQGAIHPVDPPTPPTTEK